MKLVFLIIIIFFFFQREGTLEIQKFGVLLKPLLHLFLTFFGRLLPMGF